MNYFRNKVSGRVVCGKGFPYGYDLEQWEQLLGDDLKRFEKLLSEKKRLWVDWMYECYVSGEYAILKYKVGLLWYEYSIFISAEKDE